MYTVEYIARYFILLLYISYYCYYFRLLFYITITILD